MDRHYTKALLVGKAASDDGKKVFTFRATSEAVDRHGEIVTADGWEFRNWEANPVILDSHDYYGGIEAIVGRGAGPLRLVDKAWEVDIVFSDSPKGRLAEQLVEEGSLRAVSVGFASKERVMGGSGEPMKHTVKELLEISLVAIPANPEAVRVRSLAGMAQTLAEETKAGRTLSAKNESLIRSAADQLQTVLASLGNADGEGKSASGEAADAAEPVLVADLTALRAFVGKE